MEARKIIRRIGSAFLYSLGVCFSALCLIHIFKLPDSFQSPFLSSQGILHPKVDLEAGILLLISLCCFYFKLIRRLTEQIKLSKLKVSNIEFTFDFFDHTDFENSSINAKEALLLLLDKKLKDIHQQFIKIIRQTSKIPSDYKQDASILDNEERCASLLFTYGVITIEYLGSLIALYKYNADISFDPKTSDDKILIKAIGLAATLLANIQNKPTYFN